MEPDEKEETKIKFFLEAFLKYLIRNIEWKDLILDYHDYTPAQREHLSQIGRQHPEEATERCLEMILNDVQTEGKYTALLTALEHAKNQKVIDILKGNLIPTNETNRIMMYKYGRTICEELTAIDILDPLCAVGVLDDKGRQEIHQKANMSGKWEAAFSLMFLLPKKNTDWYRHFISTLLNTDYESLARRIDGILCMKIEAAGDTDLVSGNLPSCRFISSNTNVGLPYDEISSDPSVDNIRHEIDGDGSIREHVVRDYYEPPLNNLDDPPPPTPPLPPCSLDTETSNLSIELIHTQAEEKLSNIDCNLQSSDVKTKFEKMASINKNIPVEQDKSTRRTEQSILNSFESDLRPICNLTDSVSSEMFDLVEDSVRLTIINHETIIYVRNVSKKSIPIVGKLTALNIENDSVVALQVYDSNKMHLMSVGNTVLLSNYAINNDDMIVTYKTYVDLIEIGMKHATMPSQNENESLKASKATACISVSEAACLRNKTKQPMGFAGTFSASDDADKKHQASVAARNVVTDIHSNGFCNSNTNIKGRSMSNWKQGVLYTVLGIKTLDPYRSCIREECKRKQIDKANNICPVCKKRNTTFGLSARCKITMKKSDDSDTPSSYMIFTHLLEKLCSCVGVEMDLNNVQTTKENIVATLPVTLELEMHGTKISKFIRKI